MLFQRDCIDIHEIILVEILIFLNLCHFLIKWGYFMRYCLLKKFGLRIKIYSQNIHSSNWVKKMIGSGLVALTCVYIHKKSVRITI